MQPNNACWAFALERYRYLIIALLLPLISACSPNFEKMAEQRLKFARQNKGDIHIAAIQDTANSHYINGILLAAKEINRRPGKLLGRSVKVNIEQGGKDFESSKPVIRRIAANPKITAVLGHRSSSIAVPASVIYERSQVIFMSPFATAQSLTGHDFNYTFRMAPSNNIMADQVASVANMLGYKDIVILYSRDDLSRELAFLFEDAAINQGIKLVKRSSFFEGRRNYRPIISQFNSKKFDAIFIAASGTTAGRVVLQLREMGIEKPIIGSDSLNDPVYAEVAGQAANKTIIPTLYNPDKRNLSVKKFIETYEVGYQSLPDYNAAQGYDSMMLLAHAIERTGITLTPLIQSTLHFMPAWVGVTGLHGYDQTGELEGKKYFFAARQDNKWFDLPAIQLPYLIQRLQKNYATRQGVTLPGVDFLNVFYQQIHEDDHQVQLLALAQEILNFKKIGIIYENTEIGRKASGYELLTQLTSIKKDVEIVGCNIAFSLLSPQEIKESMTDCYGKFSLSVDAILSPPPYIITDNDFLRKLNKGLTFFKIPTLSLQPDNDDPNISLTLGVRSDINLKDNQLVQAYNGLVNNMKTRQFNELLKNFPEISVNLTNLENYGINVGPIFDLSPDLYLTPESIITGNEDEPQ